MHLNAINPHLHLREGAKNRLPQKTLLIMKLMFLFLFATCLQLQAKVNAQKLNLDAKNEKLSAVLSQIKSQTGYNFFYNETTLKKAKPVTVRIVNQSLQSTLEKCFSGQPLTYIITNKLIVIKEKVTVSPPPSIVTAVVVNKIIHGRVTDSTGKPIPGASVIIKGTHKGDITNDKGEYHINANPGDVLVFKYVGYTTKEISISDNSEVNMILKPEVSSLSDMVIVGYGVIKKVDLTGAVATLSSKEIENRPVTSVANALQGTMPGVAVTSAVTGQPGNDAATIRIRGIGTLNNSNAMVVVDGVISSMNNVNPNDIASISVLKDAASAAIYGSRAANGVILITTKRGKSGQAQISYSGYVGKQKATALPDFLPSWQAATLYNQALKNEGKAVRWTDDEIQKFKDGSDPYNYPNTDWLGLFYNGNGVQQNHYVSVNGGSDKNQYSLSTGIFDENGIVKKTNAKRYTSRFNLNSQIAKHLKANANIAFTYSGKQEPSNPYTGDFTQLVRQINRIASTIPYKYKNGDYGHIADGNPMAWLEGNSLNAYSYYNLVANAGLDWEIINGLHFKPSVSYVMDISHIKDFSADQQYYNSDGSLGAYQGPSSVKDINTFSNVVTFQDLLEYGRSFGKHNFKILGGYSQEYTKGSYDDGYRKGFLNNELTDINLGSTDGQTTSGYSYDLGLQSVFGRFNYNYDERYLFEANLRDDGSSRFASDNRWALYPSFSAGWNISREAFFSNLRSVFSNLKLRASWGKLGNQTISSSLPIDVQYYPSIPLISSDQNYTFGGTAAGIATGVAPVNGANANIVWESTRESNVGIDAAIMHNKVNFSVDYFNKLTTGILIDVPVAATYGKKPPVQNAGSVVNRGWEFSVAYNDTKGEFTYGASLNASFIHNEVTYLDGTGPTISSYTFRQVGYPINSLYGYVAQGIFQTDDQVKNHAYQSPNTAAGDLIYKDIDGNDTINSADRQYLGNFYPKVTFGLNLTASWKGWDVAILLQGAAGVKTYLDLGKLGGVSADANKPTVALLDTWTTDNTNASLPRIWYSYQQNDPTNTPSSFWVKDGSYIRVKNLQVGYTLPEKWTKRAGISRLRIYYSGQNILTFDHLYKWIDPEQASTSSIYYYPQVKVNTVGLNVTF